MTSVRLVTVLFTLLSPKVTPPSSSVPQFTFPTTVLSEGMPPLPRPRSPDKPLRLREGGWLAQGHTVGSKPRFPIPSPAPPAHLYKVTSLYFRFEG